MAQENRVEVINRMGWRKDFVLDKPIIQIGCDARNDIVLDDGTQSSVAARHAQLLPSSVNQSGLRLINLSDQPIALLGPEEGVLAAAATIAPRTSGEIASGDRVRIGEFTLIFHGGEQRSEVVKLSVETNGKTLAPDRPLTGNLTIHHVGNKAAVQFKIELEGLPPDAYEIGPGPVLFPNAEKQVGFTLNHSNGAYPPAGTQRITFHVSAPDAYPGERASVTHEIEVAPVYRHKMRVVVMETQDYSLS
jgi:hypothetical protein